MQLGNNLKRATGNTSQFTSNPQITKSICKKSHNCPGFPKIMEVNRYHSMLSIFGDKPSGHIGNTLCYIPETFDMFFTIVCWKDAPHFWMLHLETAKAIKELRKLSSNTPWRAVANDEFFADFNQAAPSCCIASWDAYGWTWYPSVDVNIAVLYE